jgi:EAL domain-containing protein (putative c-di-GMP-specific phosphodiesterase class I)
VDTLKIDRSFVSGMASDSETHEIVRIIIILAHTLGLKVVAEGIETEEQMEMLKRLGCEIGQGYLFSKPSDADTIDRILAAKYVTQPSRPGRT